LKGGKLKLYIIKNVHFIANFSFYHIFSRKIAGKGTLLVAVIIYVLLIDYEDNSLYTNNNNHNECWQIKGGGK
jgi:hypothetical protein